MNKFKIKSSKLSVFFLLFFVVILVSYPLLQRNFIYGDDWNYHLARIESIKDGLAAQNFPVKIHYNLLDGYGYGSGLFYPQLFLYIPALIRLTGVSLSLSYKLFAVMILSATVVLAYFCAKHITKSRYAAVCCALIYASSRVVVGDMYLRSALGESLAAVFIPLVVCGLYNLVHEEFNNPFYLIFGFLGTIYSHTITLAILLTVTLIVVVFNAKRIFFKDKRIGKSIFLKLAGSAVVVLTCSIYFWLPFLEQTVNCKFNISALGASLYVNMSEISSLFSNTDYHGIGFSLIVLSTVCLLCRYNEKTKIYLHYIVIGVLIVLMTTWLFPWGLVDLTALKSIQFPQRLFPLASFCLALGIAGSCNCMVFKRQSRQLCLLIVFAIASASCINTLNCYIGDRCKGPLPADIYHDTEYSCYTPYSSIGGEGGYHWLPIGTDMSLLTTPNTVKTDTGSLSAVRESSKLVFDYNAQNECGYFDVPLIYYKGYTAKLTDANAKQWDLTVSKSPDNNLVRVSPRPGVYGRITVEYSGTTIQRIALIVNIIGAVLVFVYLVWGKKHPKN